MARIFPTKYTKKLKSQDPNEIVELEEFECRTTNDYVPWESLSSDVKTVKLTPEQMELYLAGKLNIEQL